MIRVALDAMGGDYAPTAVVEGAVLAAKAAQGRYEVLLCGATTEIQSLIQGLGYDGKGLEIIEAPEIVAMDESPSAVLKTKPNSGLVKCVGLQKAGMAHASLSAGNSGAMMAACLMLLGRVGNMPRPAIATVMPGLGRKWVLCDAGANVDEKAATLVAFGISGSIYAEHVLGRSRPKVGLLNIGEEEKKGPEVLQEAHQLLKQAPINFIGNVEGRDLLQGEVDVVVAPGYAGNIVLKLMEGFHEYFLKLFGDLNTPAANQFKQDWDYANIGGAMLLGLNGTGIITHGRADARTIHNGIELAYRFADAKIADSIAQKLATVA
jgi:phosphate acyltransferase